MSVSVLILTLNEERDLPACLASVAWCDDIVVLDSYSSDGTEQICRAAGGRFVQRRFDDYSAHRDWARREIEYKHPWVFSLDADERFTPELAQEVREVTATAPAEETMYLVRRKDQFMGRWIRHSSSYPIWFERLCRPERTWMTDRRINEHVATDGLVRRLDGHLLHYPFSKGLSHWLDRHNRYSTMEAQEYLKELGRGRVDWRSLLARDPIARRLALKNLACRLPCRPLAKFLYLGVLRRGLLDGRAGLTYCLLQSLYEYMIELKVEELRQAEAPPQTPE